MKFNDTRKDTNDSAGKKGEMMEKRQRFSARRAERQAERKEEIRVEEEDHEKK
jgi:hypothetical protein